MMNLTITFLIIFSTFVCFWLQSVQAKSPQSSSNTINNETKYPICVIGGGISGLNVAILLQNKGHQVHLFEKNALPGGKMVTFRLHDEVQVEMCPLFYAHWHDSLLKYIEEFQLTSQPYNLSDIMGLDPQKGVVGPLRPFSSDEETKIKDSAQRYLVHRSKYEKDLSFDPDYFGYTQASPDLFVSIGQWLDDRQLGPLKPIFWFILTVQGYGALDDTPALYALKFIDEKQILAKINRPDHCFTLKEGLDVLARKMADKIQNLYLNHHVGQITRLNSAARGNFQAKNSLGYSSILISFNRATYNFKRTKCHSVILAFPPLGQNVDKIVSDLTPEEKDVLDEVKIKKYSSAANIVPGLENNLYFEAISTSNSTTKGDVGLLQFVEPRGTGEIVGLTRQSSKSLKNVYSSYSWIRGDFNSIPTPLERFQIDQELGKTLKKISPESKTLFREVSEYFPHVGRKALEDNFYQKFHSIQGQGGLYYATTLLGFEIMESALEMGEGFVQKYF